MEFYYLVYSEADADANGCVSMYRTDQGDNVIVTMASKSPDWKEHYLWKDAHEVYAGLVKFLKKVQERQKEEIEEIAPPPWYDE